MRSNADNDPSARRKVTESAGEKLKVGCHFPETCSPLAGEFDLLLLSPSMHFTFGKVPVVVEQPAYESV